MSNTTKQKAKKIRCIYTGLRLRQDLYDRIAMYKSIDNRPSMSNAIEVLILKGLDSVKQC